MFGRLRDWWRRRRLARRALFVYWNGTRWLYGDPAVLWKQLYARPDWDLARVLALADSGHEPEASDVHSHLVEVFDLEPYDVTTGRGLTRWEVQDVLNQFGACVRELKKKFSHGWIPWQLAALEYSTDQADQAEPPQSSPASDSASTASASDVSSTSPVASSPA